MEYLFCIWAIVYIVFNLPVPPPGGGMGIARLIVGLVGVILMVLVLLGMTGHRVGG